MDYEPTPFTFEAFRDYIRAAFPVEPLSVIERLPGQQGTSHWQVRLSNRIINWWPFSRGGTVFVDWTAGPKRTGKGLTTRARAVTDVASIIMETNV